MVASAERQGGHMETTSDDPTQGEKAQKRYEALLDLYPRDLTREMVKAFMDAQPPDDRVMLLDMSAEELEAELTKDFDGLEEAGPDELAEIDKMKQLFREVRGK